MRLLCFALLGWWLVRSQAFKTTPTVWLLAEDFDPSTNHWTIHGSGGGIDVNVTGLLSVSEDAEPEHGAALPLTSVRGDNSSTIDFGSIVPVNYTICTLSRYTSNDPERQRRIFTSTGRIPQAFDKRGRSSTNWLHGHWGHPNDVGSAGLAFYGTPKGPGWPENVLAKNTNWAAVCGRNSGPQTPTQLLVNGRPMALESAYGGNSPDSLTINLWQGNRNALENELERSDFAVAEVIIWDQGLPDSQMKEAMNYLLERMNPTCKEGQGSADECRCGPMWCSTSRCFKSNNFCLQKCSVEAGGFSASYPCGCGLATCHDGDQCFLSLDYCKPPACMPSVVTGQTCSCGNSTCSEGQLCFEEGSSCYDCGRWMMARPGSQECVLDKWLLSTVSMGFFALTAGLALLGTQVRLLHTYSSDLCLAGRRLPIQDVSTEKDRVVLTTCGPHHLRQHRRWRSFPLTLEGTGHHALDQLGGQGGLRARLISPDQLELLDKAGLPLLGKYDTSKGEARLSAWRTLLHTTLAGWLPCHVPLAYAVPTLILGGALGAGTAGQVSASGQGMRDVSGAVAGVAVVIAAVSSWLYHRHVCVTPLQRRLAEFHARLTQENPHPKPCERGPGRAIRIGQVWDLWNFFQVFVQERTMYYLEPNIIRPLTAKLGLSYAELVGPSQVEWFVSHYWGHSFFDTISAIRKHAQKFCDGRDWTQIAYWICTLSNNQWMLEDELGHGLWEHSSFYHTLRNATCRGTCLVLDEHVMPLSRSWCLFEFMQTIKRTEQNDSSFVGLYFCTSSGIVNTGEASMEVVLNIGKKVSGLALEDANASSREDKDMIDALVVAELGSFNAINSKLRDHIIMALTTCQYAALREFKRVSSSLDVSHLDTTASAAPPCRRLSWEEASAPLFVELLGKRYKIDTAAGAFAKIKAFLEDYTGTASPKELQIQKLRSVSSKVLEDEDAWNVHAMQSFPETAGQGPACGGDEVAALLLRIATVIAQASNSDAAASNAATSDSGPCFLGRMQQSTGQQDKDARWGMRMSSPGVASE